MVPLGPGPPAFPPEIAILLACARRVLDSETQRRLPALLARGPDWGRLVRLATAHGVAPLVYRQLARADGGGVPVTALDDLRARFEANAANSVRLAGHLTEVLAALERGGVSVLPYKGPALAVGAYGSLLLRVFHDLDLLVPRRDLERARQVLRSLGYAPEVPLTAAQEAALDASDRAQAFFHDRAGVTVELHAAVAPAALAARVDLGGLEADVEPLRLGASTIRTLTPEALLPVLALHGTKHLWVRLLWICDVAELIRARPALDWARTRARARAWGLERMLLLAVRLAADLLAAPTPHAVRQAAAHPAIDGLVGRVTRRLLAADPCPPGALESARFHLRSLERWGDRLRYCRLAARPTEGDLGARSLPAPVRLLHYPLRAARLLGLPARRAARRRFGPAVGDLPSGRPSTDPARSAGPRPSS